MKNLTPPPRPKVKPLPSSQFNNNPEKFMQDLIKNADNRVLELQLQINTLVNLKRAYKRVLKRLQ